MKLKIKSFKLRLWLYFVLFTAVIFTVLWLLQTVFIQSFYNDMLIKNTKEAAAKITECSGDEKFGDILDELSLNNSILVYITKTDGSIIFSSDQFKGLSARNHMKHLSDEKKQDDKSSFSENRHMGDGIRPRGEYRSLPEGYDEFLKSLEASENGIYESTSDGLYIYGTYIDGDDGEKNVLYISTTLDAVGPAVDIIRLQLVWGTVISLVTGFILAWFIARSFSQPVAGLTEKAEHIGEDNFPRDYKKGFCSELDELSDVLDETSDKLIKSRTFQRELLANVSHDLRTPLTMIKGYAEMVRDFSRTDEQQCSEDIGVIIREADRLSAMINEILEYSEMQSAERTPEAESVDMSSVVRRVCGNFESLYSRDGGHIETDIADGIRIMGYAGKLERAAYNLLDNAVRHNGESRLINVYLKKDGSQARLCITDHGNGIPEAELENIWDRYYTYRQRDKKGVSGLGLAIVKQIALQHGGTCSAESEVGKGSSFILTIPLE